MDGLGPSPSHSVSTPVLRRTGQQLEVPVSFITPCNSQKSLKHDQCLRFITLRDSA